MSSNAPQMQTINVAHRLSTLRDTNLIVVIQSGEVIEFGSYNQLIKNTAAPYSVMVQLQKALVVDGQSLLPTELTESKTLIDDVVITTKKIELIVTGSHHEEQSNQSVEKEDSRPSWRQLIEMNRPEWKSALMGCIAALLNGLIQPTLAFAQGAMLSMFFLKDHNEIRSQTRALCYTFVAITASAFIVSVLNITILGLWEKI